MKVSIVIPCFNQVPAYLTAAIRSARMQTHPNVEVIVIDDGSEPGQEDVVMAAAKGNGHPVMYSYKENGGVASALNQGIEIANGEFIAWLSSDDLQHREFVAKSLAAIRTQISRDVEDAPGIMINTPYVSYCGYSEGPLPQIRATWGAAQYLD